MKRFQKLIDLSAYIEGFPLSEPAVRPVVTTAQADATSKLQHLSGVQVVAARPEARQQGGSDTFTTVLSTAFFVLDKGLGAAATPERERAQYAALLEIASRIVERVCEDATSGECGLLSGLSVASVEIVPEASVFGGWLGYSVEINFE